MCRGVAKKSKRKKAGFVYQVPFFQTHTVGTVCFLCHLAALHLRKDAAPLRSEEARATAEPAECWKFARRKFAG